VFNAFGPRNAHFNDAMAAAAKVAPYINAQCAREALSSDGLGATIWAAVDSGEITPEEAALLVRSLLSAGLDTTVVGIGNALYAFATNPEQWRALRQNANLTRPAFDEVLRWESPIQTFFRTTTRPVDVGGIEIPSDAKILLFLASANRDPRKWDDPERFDVSRRAAGHVAFGAGIHLCVGQMLARLEAEMIVAALAARVERIDIVGRPRRKLGNSLRQFASLPIELKPA
jgi:cytochrome P450